MSAVSVLLFSAVIGLVGSGGGAVSGVGGAGRGAGGGGGGVGSGGSVGAGSSITAGRASAPSIGSPSMGSTAGSRISIPAPAPRIQTPAPTSRIDLPSSRGFSPSGRMGGDQGSVLRVTPRPSPSMPSDDPTPRGSL